MVCKGLTQWQFRSNPSTMPPGAKRLQPPSCVNIRSTVTRKRLRFPANRQLGNLGVQWRGMLVSRCKRERTTCAGRTRRQVLLKRAFDLTAAAGLLLLFSPLIFGIAATALILQGRPIIFRQQRLGLRGTPFAIVKFRTMKQAHESSGASASDQERVTPFGKILRATSLDELPELTNVFGGEMSMVGPRPLLPEYLQRYTPEQARRHDVKPGITGWAQVNGRNALSWEERFALDVWYVDNWTLWLDLKILLLTVPKVLTRKDVNAAGDTTMPEFMGSASTKQTNMNPENNGQKRLFGKPVKRKPVAKRKNFKFSL